MFNSYHVQLNKQFEVKLRKKLFGYQNNYKLHTHFKFLHFSFFVVTLYVMVLLK